MNDTRLSLSDWTFAPHPRQTSSPGHLRCRGAEYCDERVCLSDCVSVCPRAYLWNYTSDLQLFVLVTYGRGWVLLWQHCYMLCISSLWMMSYFHNKPYSGMSLKRVTSLRRRAQPNAPAASYWLRRVLDDGGRRDWDESIVQAVPGAEPAMRHCIVVARV